MARAYSLDLRERVIAAVDRGGKPSEVAERFEITERTIWSWLALRAKTGRLAPRRGKVGPARKLDEHRERILQSVEAEPDLTLPERREKLNLPGCAATLWNALRRWEIKLKKKSSRPPSGNGRT